jgi:hypothetical protein
MGRIMKVTYMGVRKSHVIETEHLNGENILGDMALDGKKHIKMCVQEYGVKVWN